ncbi:hypothetical protein BJ138DRAFT_1131411 [Hygrophoropsis aurantiaca]|uniref:Uncharacterized protein n=1 Tax=Hygrophoropsis aurantiaca TaxID=72124 RepID=A0ACB7ZRL9_9AGAM|nr:hypothetical protein BJ138DRAFT_1131411 [Hygrophoropsis aurantiaca]
MRLHAKTTTHPYPPSGTSSTTGTTIVVSEAVSGLGWDVGTTASSIGLCSSALDLEAKLISAGNLEERLQVIDLLINNSGDSPHPLLSSPHLQNISWKWRGHLSSEYEHIISIGHQVKELSFGQSYISPTNGVARLRACPNLTKLDIEHLYLDRGTQNNSAPPPVFQVLHTLKTSAYGMRTCIAPILRRLTFFGKEDEMPDLVSFLSHSPRIESLTLTVYTGSCHGTILIASSTPSLITLEINFCPVAVTDGMLEVLTRTAERSTLFPNLRHLTFNGPPYSTVFAVFEFNDDVLLRMLESRCDRSQVYDNAESAPIRHSFTMHGTNKLSASLKHRLEALQAQGLVLEGSFLPST